MTLLVPDPGVVRLRLSPASKQRVAALELSRPAIAAALRGRDPEDAARIVPMIHSICGAAQGAAARAALAAARGAPPTAAIDPAVLAEARREHLWRLLLDWPKALGLPPHERMLAEGCRRLGEADFAAWAEEALTVPLAAVAQALESLPGSFGDAPTRLLPAATADETLDWRPRLDDQFAAAPTWQGSPAETGAVARQPAVDTASCLLARILARQRELVGDGVLGRVSAAAVAPGVGRAAVETARGLLLHEIELDGDRVASYSIVAPTEWNFHSDGMLRRWLEGSTAATPQALRQLAACAVLALDPCVPVRIELA